MWFIYLVNGFQSNVGSTLQPYAVSAWDAHSLITVINVVTNCMMAAVYIPLSKILVVWGRAEGFLLMAVFATIGMAMMAGSNNLATYCAANVRAINHLNSTMLTAAGVLASRLGRAYLQH